MPKKVDSLPYGGPAYLDADGIITPDQLRAASLLQGVSVCVRTANGHKRRGGYVFSYVETQTGIELKRFDGDTIATFPDWASLAEFINHVSGRSYSEREWKRCQEINLRMGVPYTPEEPVAESDDEDAD